VSKRRPPPIASRSGSLSATSLRSGSLSATAPDASDPAFAAAGCESGPDDGWTLAPPGTGNGLGTAPLDAHADSSSDPASAGAPIQSGERQDIVTRIGTTVR
jgi:hypothetical protein